MNKNPDKIQNHFPKYYKQCGDEFNGDSIFKSYKRRQEIVVPLITIKSIEHQSFNFANLYTVKRSVIDTTIKSSQNIFNTISCLANKKLITAE